MVSSFPVSLAQDFEKEVSIVMSVATVVTQSKTSSDENAVGSRPAAWRIIARTERTATRETEAGEGTLEEGRGVEDFHADFV